MVMSKCESGKISYFPIKVFIIKTKEIKEIHKASELPRSRYKILSVNGR